MDDPLNRPPTRSRTEPPAPLFYRPVHVEIDHRNLRHNFRALRRVAAPAALLTVIKANAYGHGLISIGRTMSGCGAAFLGVTSVEEALALKEHGIDTPALILGNIYPFTNLVPAIRNNVRITVASLESARMCDQVARDLGKKVHAHAKIDTGMGRIGVNVRQGLAFVQRIAEHRNVRLEGLYMHFSDSADDPKFTQQQLALFSELVREIRKRGIRVPYIHCANSAALMRFPHSRFTLVRPGISLYGVSNLAKSSVKLKPVLSWKSKIVFLKSVPAGTPVSYARTFVTRRKSRIATAAFGYADGFRRSLSNNSWVLVNGRRVPVIGRVTMDMTMLDVTHVPKARVGDEVVLVGRQGSAQIGIEELARWAGTSPYEIFCGIAQRVPRIDIY